MIKNIHFFRDLIKKHSKNYSIERESYNTNSDWDYGSAIESNQNNVEEPYFVLPVLDIDEMNGTFEIENLRNYSLAEYIDELRKFPLGLITHITRHGLRNPVTDLGAPLPSDVLHTGYGGVFIDAFEKILEDNALISRTQKLIKEGLLDFDPSLFYSVIFGVPVLIDKAEQTTAHDEQAAKYMIESTVKDINRLKTTKDFAYLDQLGVHFSVGEEIADGSYGGEYGNQIFIVYPLSMITSDCYFKENWAYKPGNSGLNDVTVINKTGKGIPLDAGIIFMPENAQVNPKNGSRFDVERNQTGVIATQASLAKDTIPSRTYWEKYLDSKGIKGNLKIVWYDASKRPSEALADWVKENDLKFINNPFEGSKNDDRYLESLREQFVTYMNKISSKAPGEDIKMQETLKLIKADECAEILRRYFFEENHIQNVNKENEYGHMK